MIRNNDDHRVDQDSTGEWPRWWRWVVITLSTLILCSCRAPGLPQRPLRANAAAAAACVPEVEQPSTPVPYDAAGTWAPPGIVRPWPAEEYVRDGGDNKLPVLVSPEWDVYGLDLEDTVAHYDSIDGRTLVEPSNKVNIYAPRFGAVRTVANLGTELQVNKAGGVMKPTQAVRQEDVTIATTGLQRIQLGLEGAARPPEAFFARQGDGKLSASMVAVGFQDNYLPFENLQVLRIGVYDESEKARLAEGVQSAIAWTSDQAVQVVLDNVAAVQVVSDQTAQATFTVKDLRNSPKLRVIKVASTQTASPGDTIDFTIRFDNTGDQPIGNIVLLDNLTTRLEFVPDSAQASVKATFRAEPNQGDSVVLRWEMASPLAPGEGGLVRFRCRVR